MKTEIIKIEKDNIDLKLIKTTAEIIKNGGLVAFPTETVYGLGADGLNSIAVDKIFKAKERPADNPLILHISNLNQLDHIAKNITAKSKLLINTFWPGPLTLVLSKKNIVPSNVTCGLKTVAVRMPNHPVALRLIEYSGTPIAAPSANLSGKPSPTKSMHVIEDLNNRINAIIDSNGVMEGLESTVLDMTGKVPEILRPGSISYEDLKTVLGKIIIDKSLDSKNKKTIPKSPGQKYRHYSPDAKIILIRGNQKKVAEYINRALLNDKKNNILSTALCTKNTAKFVDSAEISAKGCHNDYKELARDLYDDLRYFDKLALDKVYVEAVREKGLGFALMNRLNKASSEIVIV